MKQTINIKASDLHDIIKESVRRVVNEGDNYSYNGKEYMQNLASEYDKKLEPGNNYKENIKRFAQAYKTVSSEYHIGRKPSLKQFISFVKETENDALYDKIWEKYGGEYEELADMFLQNFVLKGKKQRTESKIHRIIKESVRRIISEKTEGTVKISKRYKTKKGIVLCVDIEIDTTEGYGSFEYWHKDMEDDTYMEGGLWIEDNEVVDFDGCFDLPKAVKKALNDSGYTTPW